MKPIIVITGFPHSFTSAVAKFLIQNGGYCPDLWDRPNYKYKTYESREVNRYTWLRECGFKPTDLTSYFAELPDKLIIIKSPMIGKYISELKKFTDKPIKVVYCIRNLENAIMSNIQKNPKKMTNEEYINYFNKIYYGIQHCTYPVHPVITEHFLKKEDYAVKSLLKFCELRPKIINFTDIKPPTRTIDLRKSIENK